MESSNTIIEKVELNPEFESEQTRCRICYEEKKPLVTLCGCTGSIAFVHEDCILDWITKKMENSETIEIPPCEICHSPYSAKMKIGKKKLCFRTFCEKIIELRMGVFYVIFACLAMIIACGVILRSFLLVLGFVCGLVAMNWNNGILFIVCYLGWQLCLNIVFPMVFIKCAYTFVRDKRRLYYESVIQIVEVTLVPKFTLKSDKQMSQ